MISAAERRPGEPCETAQHHEFDFVVGNWLVRDASGRVAGTATVAKAYGGCVLIETWLGVGSASGSLGVIGYQQKAGRWHRDFLDSGGVVLSLEGQREGPAMVMTGKDYPADGPRLHRVTWSAQGDGTVQEQWYTSVDAGRSWQVKFDGVFHRIAE
jgi:hypothetical protein